MDVLPLIKIYQTRFSASGIDNAKRVAEELLAHLLNCNPLEIYLRTSALSPKILQMMEQLAQRIELHEPLQYVIGHVDFFGLKIKCDSRALIPRPETELLVEEILASPIWNPQPPHIIEVGTGSGCIILALATHHPEAEFTAIDLSNEALHLAQENARFHHLEPKIKWIKTSLLNGLAPIKADAVVANLPYISTSHWEALDSSVRNHEPRVALESSPSGMELIEKLTAQTRKILRPGGMLFLEFGYDQGDAVFQCLQQNGYSNIQIKPDLNHHDRMAVATLP